MIFHLFPELNLLFKSNNMLCNGCFVSKVHSALHVKLFNNFQYVSNLFLYLINKKIMNNEDFIAGFQN